MTWAIGGCNCHNEGEELAKMEKARGGNPKLTGTKRAPVVAQPMTLSELGIDKKESARAQKIASIPKETLAAHLADVKASGGEITTAAVLRLASETER